MFENLNPLDRPTAWLEIFLLMLGAFLIGYLMARSYYKRKSRKDIEDLEREKNKYKTLSMEHPNAPHNSGLRVVKTRERAGRLAQLEPELVVNPDMSIDVVDKPTLNFDSFGRASEDDKDDLKLISGIGPFIEKKLNGIGIYTFEQISKFSSKDIEDVTNLIEFFPGRIERDKWAKQAKDLMP